MESAILLCKRGDISALNYLSSVLEKTKEIKIINRIILGIIDIGIPAIPVLIKSFPKTSHVSEHYHVQSNFEWGIIHATPIESRNARLSDVKFDPVLKILRKTFGNYLIIENVSGDYKHYYIHNSGSNEIYGNINTRYTIYWGAHTLNMITGKDFGVDQEKWQEWWNQVSKKEEFSNTISEIKSVDDNKPQIQTSEGNLELDALTTIILNTGKEFIGVLKEISSNGFVLDIGGSRITFNKSAIKSIVQ